MMQLARLDKANEFGVEKHLTDAGGATIDVQIDDSDR